MQTRGAAFEKVKGNDQQVMRKTRKSLFQVSFIPQKGLVSSTTDGRGAVTNFTYTLSGFITGVNSTTASHASVHKTLDQAGWMTQLTDQNASAYGFTFDNRDLVLTKTDPFRAVTLFFYRNDGKLDHVTDRNGEITSFGYTPSGKTAGITYPEGSVTFTCDAHDRLSYMADSLGRTHYVYDGHNRLQSVTEYGRICGTSH